MQNTWRTCRLGNESVLAVKRWRIGELEANRFFVFNERRDSRGGESQSFLRVRATTKRGEAEGAEVGTTEFRRDAQAAANCSGDEQKIA